MKSSFLYGHILSLVHAVFQECVVPGDIVIDATCGNGHDTRMLAQLLHGRGQVFSYDIQEEALVSAKQLVADLSEEQKHTIQWMHRSHVDLPDLPVKLIHYNLGYLPGKDKTIVTLKETTLASVQKALTLLIQGGVMTIVAYPGHEEGYHELVALQNYFKTLDAHHWSVSHFSLVNRHLAPQLFTVVKQ